MNYPKQLPLNTNLDLTTVTESVQIKGIADIPKDWFYDPKTSAIQVTTPAAASRIYSVQSAKN